VLSLVGVLISIGGGEGVHDLFWDGSLQGWAAAAAPAGAAELQGPVIPAAGVHYLQSSIHL
jgi:hypothetical protein